MILPEKINNISKIGLISDTHVPSRLRYLPSIIHKIFNDVDAIIHAGDFTSKDVITELESVAPLFGVMGNMDPHEIHLPQQKTILVNEKFLFAICHGAGLHSTTEERMFNKFKEIRPNAIIYGHTHIPKISKKEEILLVNPGSLCSAEPSVGLIVFNGDILIPEIIKL